MTEPRLLGGCGAAETLLETGLPGSRLRRMVALAERIGETPGQRGGFTPQTQQIDRRLSAETIAALVQAYRDGASTPELRQRHGLGQSSVIKILHEHEVEMRGQGLAATDIAPAGSRFRDGETLAQLGERFGVSPIAVRRALVSAGVSMRPRRHTQK